MARRKKTIATIDAETDPFKFGRVPAPFCWGFYSGDTYQSFWGDNCTEQLIEFLQDESDLIIYAHNGGKFDFFYMIEYLDEELFLIDGRIAKATLFGGRIEIRDSWLILPLPLSAMEKDETDYSTFERHCREKHRKDILNYLYGDCRYLWEWVTRFIDEYGNGLTLAGTAFKQLKKTGYVVGKTFDQYDSLFRQFYYGGRVQCFEVGAFKGDFQYVDINSAYPWAMKMPHWHGGGYRETFRFPEGDNGSWFAKIRAKSYGALPLRENNKLYFPDDGIEREYFVTGWEILAGLKTKTLEIVKINRVYVPNAKQCFTEYVDKFFAIKKHAEEIGDKALRQFAKLFLNACYGKFGQDGRKFKKNSLQEVGDWPEGDGWEPDECFMDGYMMFSKPDPVDSFYNVSTAASVTGCVRAYLWESICSTDRPMYCDTDSIICENFGGDMGKELGQWDLEAEASEAYIAQRKMYALKTKSGPNKKACKGVNLSYDEIKDGIVNKKILLNEKIAPSFNLKYGARFQARTVDLKNIEKNALSSPQ